MAAVGPAAIAGEGDAPGGPTAARVRLVLASASPARLKTLRAAGLDPEVVVSGVEEEQVGAESVVALAGSLARLKADAVAARLAREPGPGQAGSGSTQTPRTVVVGCDSLLELDGEALGKPRSAAEATARWQRMRGRTGLLHTGHCVIVLDSGPESRCEAVATTRVHFAELSDTEIEAYVETGEPLDVAGAFTVDGLGGAFVSGIEGDHHNVVGISLPLLRRMFADLGVAWPSLWVRTA